MQEGNDKRINDALQENDEAIRDIIKTSYESFPEAPERDMVLVSSGFALGWVTVSSQDTQDTQNTHKEYNLTESVALVASTLGKLDDLILSGALDAAEVEPVRNPLAKFITEHKEARRKAVLIFLQQQYGHLAGALLAENRGYTDEEALEIGVSAAAANRGHFFGFAVFSGDLAKVRCQCPVHLEQGLIDHKITAEEAYATLRTRYGSTHAAMVAFGRWLSTFVHAKLSMHNEYEKLDPGTLDAAAAGKLSNGLFSRLMFHGKESGEG